MRKFLNGLFFFMTFLGISGILLLWVPQILKITPKVVVSGSMEPEIPVGSVVYIAETVSPEEIREQDIIAYELEHGMEVLHRVVVVNEEKQVFRTKGDANNAIDPAEISYENYHGKAIAKIPYIGYFLYYMQNRKIPMYLVMIGFAAAGADYLLEKKEERGKIREKKV